jgi:hypothetical protein
MVLPRLRNESGAQRWTLTSRATASSARPPSPFSIIRK